MVNWCNIVADANERDNQDGENDNSWWKQTFQDYEKYDRQIDRPVVEVQHQFPVSHSRPSRWPRVGLLLRLLF